MHLRRVLRVPVYVVMFIKICLLKNLSRQIFYVRIFTLYAFSQ